MQFGITNGVTSRTTAAGSGMTAGKITPSPIVITKSADAATVPLFLAAASGKYTAKGTIAFVKPGQPPATVLSYELANVLISSYSAGNGYETIELVYDSIVIGYASQKPDGSMNTPIKGGWNFVKNTKL